MSHFGPIIRIFEKPSALRGQFQIPSDSPKGPRSAPNVRACESRCMCRVLRSLAACGQAKKLDSKQINSAARARLRFLKPQFSHMPNMELPNIRSRTVVQIELGTAVSHRTNWWLVAA